MMTAESRDFSVATYSVASLTGVACATSTFTGIAGGPLACAFSVAFPEHPTVAPVQATANRKRLSTQALCCLTTMNPLPVPEMMKNYHTEQKAFGGSLEPQLDGVTVQA